MKIKVHEHSIAFLSENCAESYQLDAVKEEMKKFGHDVYEFDSRYRGGEEFGIGVFIKPTPQPKVYGNC